MCHADTLENVLFSQFFSHKWYGHLYFFLEKQKQSNNTFDNILE